MLEPQFAARRRESYRRDKRLHASAGGTYSSPATLQPNKGEAMRIVRITPLLSSLVFALCANYAAAQQARPPYGAPVNLDTAKKIAAGAIAESKKHNWRMAVAVVDNHGFLVYYE